MAGCWSWLWFGLLGFISFFPRTHTAKFFWGMGMLESQGICSLFICVRLLVMVLPSLEASVNRFPKCPTHYKHLCNVHLGWRLPPCQGLYAIQVSCLATITYHLALSTSMTASSANNIGSELLNTDELKTPLVEKDPASSNTCRGEHTRVGRGTGAWNQGFTKQGYQQEITDDMLYISGLTAAIKRWSRPLAWKCLPRGSWQQGGGRRIKIRQKMWWERLLSRAIRSKFFPLLSPLKHEEQEQSKEPAQFFNQRWFFVEIGVVLCFTENCRGCSLSVKKLFSHRGASDF